MARKMTLHAGQEELKSGIRHLDNNLRLAVEEQPGRSLAAQLTTRSQGVNHGILLIYMISFCTTAPRILMIFLWETVRLMYEV